MTPFTNKANNISRVINNNNYMSAMGMIFAEAMFEALILKRPEHEKLNVVYFFYLLNMGKVQGLAIFFFYLFSAYRNSCD